MRKNIIALVLIVPLLFVFVVFSTTNAASLGVEIKPNAIHILNKPENDTLLIDLSDPVSYTMAVEVLPQNATDKRYTFRVEEVEGSDLADVSVNSKGAVVAHSPGTARIVASTAAGAGTEDSITVIVRSSAPYDFSFSLFSQLGQSVLKENGGSGYTASIESGKYSYETKLVPATFSGGLVEQTGGDAPAVIDENAHTILFPFSGKCELTATVPDGVNGDLKKSVYLTIGKPKTSSGITVNGGQGGTVLLAEGARKASLYVEADEQPLFEAEGASGETVPLEGKNRYRIDITFQGDLTEVAALIRAGVNSEPVRFSFQSYAYTVRSDSLSFSEEEGYTATVLAGTKTSFYILPAAEDESVSFRWECSGTDGSIQIQQDGKICVLNAAASGDLVLTVQAYRGGEPLLDPVRIAVDVIRQVDAVQILNKSSVGLAGRYTVAGKRWEGDALAQNTYAVRVMAYGAGGALKGTDDLLLTSSDEGVATLERGEDGIWLVPHADGETVVTAEWKGNAVYGSRARASLTLSVAADGVEVNDAPCLKKTAEEGLPIVLGQDIMLGTDKDGLPLSLEERRASLGSMRSTYNTMYYTNVGKAEEAVVNYALEFKNDVYGNGFTINAEYIANAKDGAGIPTLFRGPIWFVNYGEHLASVAGQDNIGFLIRTDGVTLYNLTLMNCSDASLVGDSGNQYDLTYLNNVGTTLEVNASCNLLNCRIRNGRNVVRAYGGNREGNNYFVDPKSYDRTEEERILVRIEGCILSQGREFLLKIGTNHAVQSGIKTGGNEPSLLKENGEPYSVTEENLADEKFYQKYVLTDVTIKDSVMETCGFFCVGIESNFSGPLLNKNGSPVAARFEGWPGTGGTSYASVLRLEGDVRLYDWKDLSLIDSSTLIDTVMADLKLNVAAMLNFVCDKYPEKFGTVMEEREGKQYVHGGIAFYGGGKNYSMLSMEGLAESCRGFSEYDVNISVLQESEDDSVKHQGEILPRAAGSQDFRFFLYTTDSPNNWEKQCADEASNSKYTGIKPMILF